MGLRLTQARSHSIHAGVCREGPVDPQGQHSNGNFCQMLERELGILGGGTLIAMH